MYFTVMKTVIPFSSVVEANGKTIRENNLERQHKYALGTLVEVRYDRWHGGGACQKIRARLFVVQHNRDCDGSPLYTLGSEPVENWIVPASEVFAGSSFSPKMLLASRSYSLVWGLGEDRLTPVEITPELLRGEGALRWD